jgi:alkylation response protein AidB-like acyl-CoA dehydrogenase
MRLSLTDEQVAMRELCRSLLGAGSRDAAAQDPLWTRCVELGLTAAVVPSADGGLGLGAVEAVVIAEEAGRGDLAIPLVATLGCVSLARAAQLHEPLAALAGGASGATVAGGPHATRGARFVPAPGASRGRLLGAAVRRSGHDVAVFVAVPRDADVSELPSVDGTLSMASARVDPDGSGADVTAAQWLPVPALLRAAEALGAAARMLDLAVGHAKERRQFGRPIGAFQGVKHSLVDAHVALERGRSLVYGAAAGVAGETGAPSERRASLAVGAVAHDALLAARTAVHVHGATGITLEHEVSRLYRRVRQLSSVLRWESSPVAPA